MADTDGGGLLVQIGTTQARMERELAKLVANAAKSANDMEKSFTAANTNIDTSAQKAFTNYSKGAATAAPAVKNLSGYTSNLASQLNDIGVQLAGGQSPFLIMIQQGTQISQLFTQTGGNIKTFGSILTGAVTSALNPFSLLTFAVIGLGGAAIQYFASLVSGGADANKTLEDQQKLIENTAKAWGDAVPAIQEYVDQLQRVNDLKDLDATVKILNDQTVSSVKDKVEDLRSSFGYLTQDLRQAGEEDQNIKNLQVAFDAFVDAAEHGKDVTSQVQAVQEALSASINSIGIPALGSFASAFNSVAEAAANASGKVASLSNSALTAKIFGNDQIKPLGPLSIFDGKVSSMDNVAPNVVVTDDGRFVEAPKPEERPSPEGFAPPKAPKTPKPKAARGANSYKDEVASINERTAALRAGTAAQAAINPLVNDYGFALTKAQTEQKLLADAQKAGMDITPALRDQISELATGYANATVESKKLTESQKQIQKNAQEWADTSKDVFKGFLSDLKSGKSGAEALADAMNKLSDKLLDMAVDSIFSSKPGTTGGAGIFGSIFSGIGKIFGFASGTANTGGKRGQPIGVVHGQEAVIPLPSGGKVPVQIASPAVPTKSGGSNDVVKLVLQDDSGRMADVADQRIQTHSGTIVQISVQQSVKQVKANMPTLMTDAQARSL